MRDGTDPDTLSQPLLSVHILSSCTSHFFHLCHTQKALTPLATPTTNTDPSSMKDTHMHCAVSFTVVAYHLGLLLCGVLIGIHNTLIYAHIVFN